MAVVAGESFSEAAEILYTTQSAVSKQIMALEKELHVKLFDRSKRKIVLTNEGKCVLRYAQKIMDAYNDMFMSLAEFESYEGGILSIASIPVMAQYDLTALIAVFRNEHPNINMVINECEASDILSSLERRQYELAFFRKEMADLEKYESLDIYEDRMLAVLPQSHPLSREPVISLKQLRKENFLFLNKGTRLYDLCIAACVNSGFSPSIVYTGTRSENLVELIAKGMGVSLLMGKAVSYFRAKISIIPLAENISSTVSLIKLRKKRVSNAANSFWAFVEKYVNT